METLVAINVLLAAVFAACYCYQAVFMGVRLLGKGRSFSARRLCRYAVLIAARDESAVIGQLLDSLRGQDYPARLLDLYVVADNCTDNTAQVARAHGATVFQRENRAQVGKGYALAFLLERIRRERPQTRYDGYFVFDADNLVDPRYVTEMNKVFSSGALAVTGYRNTKNFGDNWISAGYGIWFLRESEYLNRPRDFLGTSCAVSGTGFLFSQTLLDQLGGWDYFLLTEDLEFTADMAARGVKIAYCRDAVVYDEQPTRFSQSITQRSRWVRGYLQVIARRGGALARSMVEEGRFACFDVLMGTIPAVVLTVAGIALNAGLLAWGLVAAPAQLGSVLAMLLASAANSYAMLFLLGAVTLLTEWKRILCPGWKKALYAFTFPFFVFTFGIAMVLAVAGGAQWKPIRHSVALSIGQVGAAPARRRPRLEKRPKP